MTFFFYLVFYIKKAARQISGRIEKKFEDRLIFIVLKKNTRQYINQVNQMSEPCLCLFIKTSGSECLIGAANLAPSATEWDNKHIQEQILVSQKDRVEDVLKREEFDLDTYDFSDSPNLCSLESLLVRLAPTRVLYCCTGGKTLLKQLEQVFQGSNIDNLEAVPQKFFKTDSVENDVRRLIGLDGPSHDVQNLSGDRKLAGAFQIISFL